MAYPVAYSMAYRWSNLKKQNAEHCRKSLNVRTVSPTSFFCCFGGHGLISINPLYRIKNGGAGCRINSTLGKHHHYKCDHRVTVRKTSIVVDWVSVSFGNPAFLTRKMSEDGSDVRYVKYKTYFCFNECEII